MASCLAPSPAASGPDWPAQATLARLLTAAAVSSVLLFLLPRLSDWSWSPPRPKPGQGSQAQSTPAKCDTPGENESSEPRPQPQAPVGKPHPPPGDPLTRLWSMSVGRLLPPWVPAPAAAAAPRTAASPGVIADGVLGLIGHTPLVRIGSLSEESGCLVLGKAEFLNPGGSVKDRVALHIIRDALASGALSPGGLVTEGSAGSTGISLALVAAAVGCRCFVAMPDDAAAEKAQSMRAYGAEVLRVPPVSITHPDHFVHLARRKAAQEEGLSGSPGFFADQFENEANFRAHYQGTGREIWEQTGGKVDAFVAAAGTGGTLAGVSCYLKDQNPGVKCFLVDPPGSSLYNRVARGVLYTREEAEGKRRRNPQDTITEGIGLNRLTANFKLAKLDGAFRGSDMEAVQMSRRLMEKDGLFVGSSSAMNCVGAMKVAKQLGPGHTIVTVLCDSGARYLSKFYDEDYLAKWFSKTTGQCINMDGTKKKHDSSMTT